jgi:hypothetical protein
MRTILAMLSVAFATIAGATQKIGSPVAVVENYCNLHNQGLGLSGETSAKIAELVLWPEEPGWDTFLVISSYSITGDKVRGETASVNVRYEILGAIEGTRWVPVSPGLLGQLKENAVVQFTLKKTFSGWKIAEPMSYPRVGLTDSIRYFKKLSASKRNASQPRALLEKCLRELEDVAVASKGS